VFSLSLSLSLSFARETVESRKRGRGNQFPATRRECSFRFNETRTREKSNNEIINYTEILFHANVSCVGILFPSKIRMNRLKIILQAIIMTVIIHEQSRCAVSV